MILTFYLLLFLIYNIKAHTWIDFAICIDTGEIGYPRNYVDRTTVPNFDLYMTYLLEGRDPASPVCSPNQRNAIYSNRFPMLSCPAGSEVEIEYFTNGHTISDACLAGDPRPCLPNGNPPDTFWSIHTDRLIKPRKLAVLGDINSNIQFNDDSGLINVISQRNKYNFNDACDDVSSQPCRARFRIPNDFSTDTYEFIWYWIFDRNFRANGEAFTTCFDIFVTNNQQPPLTPRPPTVRPSPPPNCRQG